MDKNIELAVRQADRHIRCESLISRRLRKTLRLDTLPYDLILLIAEHLRALDVGALARVCRYLHATVMTRPIFTGLAFASLRRCRPLPLSGFQRIRDLGTDQLIRAVMKAASLEDAWCSRTPRISSRAYHAANPSAPRSRDWFRILNVPSDDALEWLSPLTTAYNVFMTKSRKVVCWDQQKDVAVAEWQFEEPSLLWKCRLAHETRTTYFAVMKMLESEGSTSEENAVTRFSLIKLQFPSADGDEPPAFAHVTDFQMTGHPFNLFLLDPTAFLLGGFVWLSSSNNIALYILHDWEQGAYSFFDTGIKWSNGATWSCYLHQKQIVIHTESEGHATEYFWPLSFLRKSVHSGFMTDTTVPLLTRHVEPLAKRSLELSPWRYDVPMWFPDSVHYVRQWWPALPGIPSLCNAVTLLLSDEDQSPLRYVITQHYFEAGLPVPDTRIADDTSDAPSHGTPEDDERKLAMTYVSRPFAISFTSTSSTNEQQVEADDDDITEVPLIATDFGHAVWLEDVYTQQPVKVPLVDQVEGVQQDREETIYRYLEKRLRFVTFPPISSMWASADSAKSTELSPHTLPTPKGLKLEEVNNICLDQSQGTVTLSVKDGKIYILYYE